MHGKWQIQEAENKLGEVIKQALENGPQTIIEQERKVVIVSKAKQSIKRNTEEKK